MRLQRVTVADFFKPWREPADALAPRRHADLRETMRAIGETPGPDCLLLKPDDAGEMKLLGGCVCFPSSWSLEEKSGAPA